MPGFPSTDLLVDKGGGGGLGGGGGWARGRCPLITVHLRLPTGCLSMSVWPTGYLSTFLTARRKKGTNTQKKKKNGNIKKEKFRGEKSTAKYSAKQASLLMQTFIKEGRSSTGQRCANQSTKTTDGNTQIPRDTLQNAQIL